jgi:hypothetical protein
MGGTLMVVSGTSAGAGEAAGNGMRAPEGARAFCCGDGLGNGRKGIGAVSQIIAVTADTGATCARLNSHTDTNSALTAPASARAAMRAWVLFFARMRLQ